SRPTLRSSRRTRLRRAVGFAYSRVFPHMLAALACSARLSLIVGRTDVLSVTRRWPFLCEQRLFALAAITSSSRSRGQTDRAAQCSPPRYGPRGSCIFVARSSGVFCLGPVATEFLAVQHSEPFAPNPALQPTVLAFGALARTTASNFPRHAARWLGAAELDRWASGTACISG